MVANLQLPKVKLALTTWHLWTSNKATGPAPLLIFFFFWGRGGLKKGKIKSNYAYSSSQSSFGIYL